MANHTFAICSYGQSPYLRECIESVIGQRSEVFIATSTPSDWLDSLAEEFSLPVYVNEGRKGIGQDWNFAYSKASGQYVTIAHQDDVYLPGYAESAVSALASNPESLIFFCDYGEIRGGEREDETLNLRIKRRLLKPLENPRRSSSQMAQWRALAFGSAICCPSVCFNRENCPNPPFVTKMSCSLDWDTWEHLHRLRGGFHYAPEVLMLHRIHEASATTKLIEDNTRASEDLEMFRRLWPRPMAGLLARMYARSMASNSI